MTLAIAVTVLVVIVAGCGGGKKKSVAPAATKAASTTATVKTTFASTKNCQELIALGAKLSQALQASSGNVASSIGDQANVLKGLASAAPAEIRGDFETFANALSTYADALTKAGFKPGKTPTPAQTAAMVDAAKSLSTPKLQAAEQHLSAWATKNCGFGTTTTG